jgi:hypothetical protein
VNNLLKISLVIGGLLCVRTGQTSGLKDAFLVLQSAQWKLRAKGNRIHKNEEIYTYLHGSLGI